MAPMNSFPIKLTSALGPVLALLVGGCAAPEVRQMHTALRAEPVLYEWHDDFGPGDVAIRLDLSEQRAYFRRGERPIGWAVVATGREGYRTPTGTFRITEKVVDKYSNAYGWIEDEFGNVIDSDARPRDPVPPGGVYRPAPMPYWMRLTDWGIGLHAGHIPDPGRPASHGCIRLPEPLAPRLFDVIEIGTRVNIVP
jgi:lipoprotein-anchoring transpeptidase ErfK/SrfK